VERSIAFYLDLLGPLGWTERVRYPTYRGTEEVVYLEDPATGSASGPLGAYLVRYGLAQASPVAYIVSEQGIEMGRPSFIHIQIERQGDGRRRVTEIASVQAA